jgi:hypothetical protein
MVGNDRVSFLVRSGMVISIVLGIGAANVQAAGQSFIGGFNTVTTLGTTVPANGDINPYGVALVPRSTGKLVAGQFLVSNFNNSGNSQGTGTTIVELSPNGSLAPFAEIDPSKVRCPGGIGLTTALVALRRGFVVVGSLPTSDGTAATAKAGCLIVLDSNGNVVETITGNHINGPWDMTAVDGDNVVALFVTNVLNGTVAAGGKVVHRGTVVRLVLTILNHSAPQLINSTVIADGFPERTDSAALVIGPTGVAFDWETGILYVADSLDNRIAAIPGALFRFDEGGPGITVSQAGSLNVPLGLAITPNRHLVAANGDDGNIVEVNPFTDKQVAVQPVDSSGGPLPGAGALFGLIAGNGGVYFVDDATNTFNLLH